jgi:pyruvate-formate lyase-activating enzyme
MSDKPIHSMYSSLVDFPGRMSLSLNVVGCNLTCPFCFNKELWSFESGSISSWDAFEWVQGQRKKLNEVGVDIGVTLTGGEPTINPHFDQLVQWLVNAELPICLHTNGLVLPKENVFDSVILSLKPSTCGVPEDYLDAMHKAVHYYSTSPGHLEVRVVREDDPALQSELDFLIRAIFGYLIYPKMSLNIVPKIQPQE